MRGIGRGQRLLSDRWGQVAKSVVDCERAVKDESGAFDAKLHM